VMHTDCQSVATTRSTTLTTSSAGADLGLEHAPQVQRLDAGLELGAHRARRENARAALCRKRRLPTPADRGLTPTMRRPEITIERSEV